MKLTLVTSLRLQTAYRQLARMAPYLLITVAVIAFRLPPIINAHDLNADAAIIGLQAIHILKGESPTLFVWGYEYQSSFEPLLAAAAFSVFGARPIVLIGLTVAGHLLFVFLVFGMLRTKVGKWAAFVVVQPLVWMPQGANYFSVYPPRQWAITWFILGLCLIDREYRPKGYWYAALGGFLVVTSVYMDRFCLVLMPATFVLGILTLFDERRLDRAIERGFACITGAAAGWLVIDKIGAKAPEALAGQEAISMSNASKNWKVLWDECLPSLFGTDITYWPDGVTAKHFIPAGVHHTVARFGALSAGFVFVFAAIAYGIPRMPWRAKRLGVFGVVLAASTFGAYLTSGFVRDFFSIRYLMPLVWALPFALAPLAAVINVRYLAVLLVPLLLDTATSGWLGYHGEVDGPKIVRLPAGLGEDEHFLQESLRLRGVEAGASTYWLAYRLSFLFREQPVIAPLYGKGNRDPSSQAAFAAAKKVAYLFHPLYEGGTPDALEKELCAIPGTCERYRIAKYSVLVVERRK